MMPLDAAHVASADAAFRCFAMPYAMLLYADAAAYALDAMLATSRYATLRRLHLLSPPFDDDSPPRCLPLRF